MTYTKEHVDACLRFIAGNSVGSDYNILDALSVAPWRVILDHIADLEAKLEASNEDRRAIAVEISAMRRKYEPTQPTPEGEKYREQLRLEREAKLQP